MPKDNSESDDSGSKQLQDKLSELWSVAANKRKALRLNKTAPYSENMRSRLNKSESHEISIATDHRLQQLKHKLNSKIEQNKHKDIEIQTLKSAISHLKNENKVLHTQIDHLFTQPKELQSIDQGYAKLTRKDQNYRTLNDKANQRQNAKTSNLDNQLSFNEVNLEDLSKQQLIRMLYSTAEYEHFVEYYTDHQLMYMSLLNDRKDKFHRKDAYESSNKLWKDEQIVDSLQQLNKSEQIGLREWQMQLIGAKFKRYYYSHEKRQLKTMKKTFHQKLKSIASFNEKLMPKQLQEIQQEKEHELIKSKFGSRKKGAK